MSHLSRAILSVFCVFIFGAGPAAAQKADPALFGALPAVEAWSISPNGETLALVRRIDGELALVFYDLTDPSATPKGVPIGDVVTHNVEWVDDEYVILLIQLTHNVDAASGQEKMNFYRWISISKDARKTKILFQRDPGYYISSAGKLVAATPNDPGHAVFSRISAEAQIGAPRVGLGSRFRSRRLHGREDTFGISLFRVNLENGAEEFLYRGNPDTVDWVVDDKGQAILRIDYDEKEEKRKIFRRRENSKSFELISEVPELKGDKSKINFHGLGDSNSEIFATTFQNSDTKALVAYDVESAQINKTVFKHEIYDVDHVLYDYLTAEAVGVSYIDDFYRRIFFDSDLQKIQKSLEKALPDAAASISEYSADKSKMLVWADYIDRPLELYLFDRSTRELSFLASVQPKLARRVYAQTTKFDYVAPDGLKINGYLTTPLDAPNTNMPLIVMPHEGSEGRVDRSFFYWSFFYAARGYAVYQPNFRGSSGYGLEFTEAAHGEWGGKMQDDITYGVNKLIADGIVDPSRICIVGNHYGGFAALTGVIKTPDLYACAISINGISDLQAMIADSSRNTVRGLAEDYWEMRIGDRIRDEDKLDAISPVKNAARVGTPVMLIHSENDTVVPFYHSEKMSDALTAARKPHEFVELEGEDHWLSKAETRTEMLRRSIDFIDKHIGG